MRSSRMSRDKWLKGWMIPGWRGACFPWLGRMGDFKKVVFSGDFGIDGVVKMNGVHVRFCIFIPVKKYQGLPEVGFCLIFFWTLLKQVKKIFLSLSERRHGCFSISSFF